MLKFFVYLGAFVSLWQKTMPSRHQSSKFHQNNIMTIYITENLHHELLTPVKVIMTKSRVIGNVVDSIEGISEAKKEKVDQSLNYIDLSIEQISAVLENMRQSKMVKKGQDHTIFEIIQPRYSR